MSCVYVFYIFQVSVGCWREYVVLVVLLLLRIGTMTWNCMFYSRVILRLPVRGARSASQAGSRGAARTTEPTPARPLRRAAGGPSDCFGHDAP